MLLGLQVNNSNPGKYGNHFDGIHAVAQACEQAGLDSVWMADHFMFPDTAHPEKEVPVLDCYVTLAAIAALTSRIRIGALVTGVPYRNPALLAKMCTTLDVVSHGRCIVGLGAAWHEPEFVAYGWPFPPVRERMERLTEAVQIVDRMMTQRPASFHGKHYSIQDAYNDPMPVQKPRPPIMIGGSGEQVTLKLVARYANYSNVGGDPAMVAHKFDVLRKHCEAVGRSVDEIVHCNHVGMLVARDAADLAMKQQQFPNFTGVAGTPDMIATQLHEYARVGSQYVTFNLLNDDSVEAVTLLGKAVVSQVAKW